MDNQKSIDVLNKLVEINNDRIEGYETALKETKDNDLKTLFSGFRLTSQNCKSELENEIRKLGGKPEDGTKVSGKFFRQWMDVKAALTNNDRKAILSSCEFGEDAAKKTYDDTVKDHLQDLPPDLQSLVRNQQTKIHADHDKVRNMRDAAAGK